MRKFFVNVSNIGASNIVIDDVSDVKHISKVLRLKIGDNVVISDGDSWEYMCKISEITADAVILDIHDKQKLATEPAVHVALFQGVPKSSKLELIVQKTVELGVKEIIPVFMDRTVVVDNGKFHKKVQRLNSISQEAAKQCKRGYIPEVLEAIKFDECVKKLQTYDMVIFPYENEKNTNIKQVLREFKETYQDNDNFRNLKIAIIIGPEGGFSDEEAEKLVKNGAKRATLGKTILRTETAAIVTVAQVMYEFEL